MSDSPISVERVRSLVKRVGFVRLALIFLGIHLPIALVASVTIGLIGPPRHDADLGVRLVVLFVASGLGMLLFILTVVKLAQASQK